MGLLALLKKWYNEVIGKHNAWAEAVFQEEWRREFPAFQQPFTDANQFLRELDDVRLRAYFYIINQFVGSDAFAVEFENIKLRFEKELALRTQSDVERAAYRATLIFIRDFEKRLRFLAAKYDEKKRLQGRELFEQLKNI